MLKKIGCIAGLFMLTACHKTIETTPLPVEIADQKLVKIVRTTISTPDVPRVTTISSESFGYDAAGKVIYEGNLVYTRDNKERIVHIVQPFGTIDGGYMHTDVHYTSEISNHVAYTIVAYTYFDGTNHVSYRDSTTFQHDKDNLQKIVSYTSDGGQPYKLDRYYSMKYDAAGNIVEIHCLVNDFGVEVTCSDYKFVNYDNKGNAIPGGDEVRANYVLWNTGNVSENNVTDEEFVSSGYSSHVSKIYDYRADGRPRSATITFDHNITVKDIYQYE